jgi:hypothetical protein
MGPVQGAVVNWAGHKYGYRNFPDEKDQSKNTLIIDFLMLGELFQNNHHKHPMSINFAKKWYEIDPTYPVIKLLTWTKIITPKNSITKIFKTETAIYFQVFNEGLFEIENGNSQLVSDDLIFKNNKIVNIYQDDKGLIIHTQTNGFFRFSNKIISSFTTSADIELDHSSVYSSCQLNNGNFAVGTISDGIFIISRSGNIEYHISQNNGLSNNTVLSLFEDFDKNLWIGLDNGINCINLQSPVKSFSDETGKLGTVYTSILFKGKLLAPFLSIQVFTAIYNRKLTS